MPIYEYRCEVCQGASEILVRNLKTEPECPHCGSKRLSKQVSVPGGLISRIAGSPGACSLSGGGCPVERPACGSAGGCCGTAR